MAHDINRLKDRIDRIDQTISDLGELKGQLSGIIHKPGWTTVAEFALVEAGLTSIHTHVEATANHYKQLIEAAQRVGQT
jgi:hypothetical protein